MSQRRDKRDRKKLEVKKETLRKMDLTDDQLKQIGGGLMTTDPPDTCPSRRVC